MNPLRYFAVFLGIVLIAGTLPSQSFADVISPRQQMKLDFTAEQVICSEGLVKITKNFASKIACVKPSSAEKLAKNGWAKQLSAEKLEEIQAMIKKKGNPAGTITTITTIKQLSSPVKAGTPAGISGYAYVFDACGTSKIVRAPEVFVTSDSETKSIKLGSMLQPGSCYTSSVIIKAADPNSISATLLNKGGISEKISSLETQIADLKSKILTAKQKIPITDDQTPSPENITNISTMKKELKNLQDQLRRYLMVLYVPSNVKVIDLDIPKSITGQPLEGMSTALISVTESVLKSENAALTRFNVVFEACSGNETIRLPIITVVSDSDSVDVKLIERIIPNSCQVGITRIDASDSESITTKISGNSGISKRIATLEMQINEIETTLADKRSQLGNLISKQLDASSTPIAEKLTLEISELRDDLLKTKTKLYGLLLKS